jgi:hypothetical protein
VGDGQFSFVREPRRIVRIFFFVNLISEGILRSSKIISPISQILPTYWILMSTQRRSATREEIISRRNQTSQKCRAPVILKSGYFFKRSINPFVKLTTEVRRTKKTCSAP